MKKLFVNLFTLIFIFSCSSKNGIPFSELTDVDSILMYNGVPYTGLAYEVTNQITFHYTLQNGRNYKTVHTIDGVTYTMELDGHKHVKSYIGKHNNGDIACKGYIKDGNIDYCDYYRPGSAFPSSRCFYKDNVPDPTKVYEFDSGGNMILPLEESFKIVEQSSSWGVYNWSPIVVLKIKNISSRTISDFKWHCQFLDTEENFEVGTDTKRIYDPWTPGLTKEITFKTYNTYPSQKYKTVNAGHLVAKITIEDKDFDTIVIKQDW